MVTSRLSSSSLCGLCGK